MNLLSFLFLAMQAGGGMPPLGYIPRSEGLAPLYGVSGNFVAGPALSREVLSAAEFPGIAAAKTTGAILINGEAFPAAPGPALFAYEGKRRVLALLLPESGDLYLWTAATRMSHTRPAIPGPPSAIAYDAAGRLRVLIHSEEGWKSGILAPLWREESLLPAEVDAASLDSRGRLWTARQTEVRCGDSLWIAGQPVVRLWPQAEEWMAIEVEGGALHAARCGHAGIYQIPGEPE